MVAYGNGKESFTTDRHKTIEKETNYQTQRITNKTDSTVDAESLVDVSC